ncbi:MAG: efflux RND transporter periplasmic adaptor subunit [Myxococcota bacterium]
MSRRVVFTLALAAGATALAAAARRPADAAPSAPSEATPRSVAVEVAQRRAHTETAVFHGLTRAAERTAVSFTMPGRVVARPVDVGGRVKKGQLIARLDAKPLRNAKAAARAELQRIEAQLAQQQRDEARARGLLDEGAATVAQLEKAQSGGDTLRAAKSAAKAQLAEQGRRLSESVLRAPFDAEVVATFVESGQVVAAGAPVVQLSGRAEHEVELAVPGRIADQLERGSTIDVRFVDPARDPVVGTIARVSGASGGTGALFKVVVTLDADASVPVGLPVVLELPVAVHDRVSVPVAALVDPSGSKPHVWVASEGRVDKRPVTLAGMVQGRVLLADGVEPSERIVVSGLTHLMPGDRVEVQGEAQ